MTANTLTIANEIGKLQVPAPLEWSANLDSVEDAVLAVTPHRSAKEPPQVFP
jgi:hypothetical protein